MCNRASNPAQTAQLFIGDALQVRSDAKIEDVSSWALCELRNLRTWLNILACSGQSDIAFDPSEIAVPILERLDSILLVLGQIDLMD